MKKQNSGVAIIELAIVLPLLLAIFFAITEFGRAIYTYNTLAKSARDGARYLSEYSPADQNWNKAVTMQNSIKDTAKYLVVYGNPTGTGSPLVPGLSTAQVNITTSSASFDLVTIAVSGYTFSPVLDFMQLLHFYTGGSPSMASITFDDISVTMRQP